MDEDGGMSKYPGNKAGAAYGTGYCDAQCPNDTKMINGEANLLKSAQICSNLLKSAHICSNLLKWNKNPNDPSSGAGAWGTCCTFSFYVSMSIFTEFSVENLHFFNRKLSSLKNSKMGFKLNCVFSGTERHLGEQQHGTGAPQRRLLRH